MKWRENYDFTNQLYGGKMACVSNKTNWFLYSNGNSSSHIICHILPLLMYTSFMPLFLKLWSCVENIAKSTCSLNTIFQRKKKTIFLIIPHIIQLNYINCNVMHCFAVEYMRAWNHSFCLHSFPLGYGEGKENRVSYKIRKNPLAWTNYNSW